MQQWDKSNWPNPDKLDLFLEDKGVKLITISEPFFTCDSKNYKEFDKNGVFAKIKMVKQLHGMTGGVLAHIMELL